MTDENKPQQINVTSHGQSGGITAHTVNVSEVPPSVDVDPEAQAEKHGDQFTTSLGLKLSGRPGRFGVVVNGEGIEELMLRQEGPTTALSNVQRGKTADGAYFFTVGNPPPGRYVVEVMSSQAPALNVTPVLD